ncbi:hypothetical protein [Mycolicibacterium fortuitum]|uniref:hypothetical protein n=1 Tax=Mycolicibacterium fortuitum TaxID=1766 RepID=UPI00261F6A34|nr:hypothetical protein [Mycolicibacterium fortuitum]
MSDHPVLTHGRRRTAAANRRRHLIEPVYNAKASVVKRAVADQPAGAGTQFQRQARSITRSWSVSAAIGTHGCLPSVHVFELDCFADQLFKARIRRVVIAQLRSVAVEILPSIPQ